MTDVASEATGAAATVPRVRLVRTVSWILTFVAIGAAAAAWFTPRPDVDADMAGDIALRALDAAGIDEATVRGIPHRGVHTRSAEAPDGSAPGSSEGQGDEQSASTTTGGASPPTVDDGGDEEAEDGIDVWIVMVDVDGDVIEMRVHDSEGQLIYVDDLIGENRDERLLDDEQWATVSTYGDDEVDTWVRRNVTGSVAAGLIVVVGFLLAKRSDVQGLRG